MIIQKSISFTYNSAEPIISDIIANTQADYMSLQLDGNFTEGVIVIEGRNAPQNDWVSLGGISLSDFAIYKTGFTKPGLFELSISSVRQLRVRTEGLNGEVELTGLLISSIET